MASFIGGSRAQIRNPKAEIWLKSEIRRPKSERSPNSEIRIPNPSYSTPRTIELWRLDIKHAPGQGLALRPSDFGFPSASRRAVAPSQRVGFRPSDFSVPI